MKVKYSRPVRLSNQRQILRNDADAAFGLERFGRVEHVLTQHTDVAVRRRQQAGQHFDSGRFTGSIGSEKAVKNAALDAQIDAVDGAEIAEEPR